MSQPLSWVVCACSFFIPLYLVRTRGLMTGGRTAWIVVLLLVPSWMTVPFKSVHLDARSLCAMAFLAGALDLPFLGKRGGGWIFPDIGIFLMVAAMTITQFAIQSVSPMAPFDPFREIALPYLVGRLFLRTPDDIVPMLPTICKCLLVLSAWALVEAITKKNPLEYLIPRSWTGEEGAVGGEELDSVRWGLKRAYGPQTHPIYLGLTFAMMLPWAVEAAIQSFNRRGPGWWKFVPLFTLAGVVCTGSRAAQICSLLVLVSMLFQSTRGVRAPIILIFVMLGWGYVVFRDDVVQGLQSYAEEGKSGESYVKIRGEFREYSGTRHRDLLFEVYEEAVENAGWLGYGTVMMQIPRDPDMDERFRSIDNHYLMFYLQYGYVGLAVFVFFAVSVVLSMLPAYFGTRGPPGRLLGGMLGSIVGCLIAMRGVWFAADFACVWLFCAGASISLVRWYREARAWEGLYVA